MMDPARAEGSSGIKEETVGVDRSGMNPILVLTILAFVFAGLYIMRRRSRLGRRIPKF